MSLKKRILHLFCFMLLSFSAILFVGCANLKTVESHNCENFDVMIISDEYLASEATCTEARKYYYSCECGNVGDETFSFGSPLGHRYDQMSTTTDHLCSEATCYTSAVYYYSCICGDNSYMTFTSGEPLQHVYDQQSTNYAYHKSDATCTNPAVYYYSCSNCGKRGENTFFYGSPQGHYFISSSTDEKHKKSDATCTTPAVYYYSCYRCEENGDTTFYSGGTLNHTYDQQSTDNKYLYAEATCVDQARYYYSCYCGAQGYNTFKSGPLKDHIDDDPVTENYYDSTCTVKGSYDTVTYCVNCHQETNREQYTIDYKPHNMSEWLSGKKATAEEDGYQYKECSNCDYEETTVSKVCATCEGDGLKDIYEECASCTDGYKYKNCSTCGGTGRYGSEQWKTCGLCKGTGQVKNGFGSYITCLCGGDGGSYVKPDCYSCSGKGKKKDGYCSTCQGYEQVLKHVDCDNCETTGEYREYTITFNACGGTGAPEEQKTTGESCVLTSDIPTRPGYTFVGWNSFTLGNKIYQPGDAYENANVELYAMWLPTCVECEGIGHFNHSNICDKCSGSGYYVVYTTRCNSCSSTNVTQHITGAGSFYICNSCLSSSATTYRNEYECYKCVDGYIHTTTDCIDCDGNGYLLPSAPIIVSYSDTKVILLKTEGYEYSLDGENWQNSNVFMGLSPATTYNFYQRMAKTDELPFGAISKVTSITTDKSECYSVPSKPEVVSVTSNSITLVYVEDCEYSIDGISWQDSNTFYDLNIVAEYTIYIRYKETSTSYAGLKSEPLVVKTDKGNQLAPGMPQLASKTSNMVELVAHDNYEYSMDGINWQTSNIFENLESGTNYTFYQRVKENSQYYASEASIGLVVKTNTY